MTQSVGFIYHPDVARSRPAVAAARALLALAGVEVWEVPRHVRPTGLAAKLRSSRLLVTLGGDGTMLYGARLAAPRGIPLLGVNLGRLGFLTELEEADLEKGLRRFLAGDYRIEERTILSTAVLRDGAQLVSSLGINEAVVHRAAHPGLIRLRISVDGEQLGTIDADGLIMATATGSTAYALAAGGPILEPDMPELLLVPMSPFALTVRPIVCSPDDSVVVELVHGAAQVDLDGYLSRRLRAGDRVRAEPYARRLAIVRLTPRQRFYQVLRDKLGWGLPLVPRQSQSR
jgi:NAD+ kinase